MDAVKLRSFPRWALASLAVAVIAASSCGGRAMRLEPLNLDRAPAEIPRPVRQLTKRDVNRIERQFERAIGAARQQKRTCRGGPCPGGTARGAQLQFQAVANAHLMNVKELPENGVVFARLRNVGDTQEDAYGFAGHEDDEDTTVWHYLVAVPAPDDYQGRPAARLFRVTYIKKNNWFDDMQVQELSWIVECDRSHPDPTYADVAFRGCAAHDALAAAPNHDPERDNAWVTCAHGCCEIIPFGSRLE